MRFLRRGRDGTRRGLLVGVTAATMLGVAPGAHAAISVSDATPVGEGTPDAALSFTVSKTYVVLGPAATVRFRTTGGTATAAADYSANAGQPVSLPNSLGGSSQVVRVPILPDALDEADESVIVTIDEATGDTSITDATATGIITDDDPAPTVSITDASGAEGTASAGSVTLPVTLSAPSGRTVTVPYTVTPGTATAPDDIDATAGSITFQAGQTVGSVTVLTVADGVDEPDETFSVTLGPLTAASPGTDTTATGTVVNDDAPVVSIGGVAAAEGTAEGPTTFSFPVTLSNPGRGPVSVRVRSGDAQAQAPGDYGAVDQVVTFVAGETSRTVTVAVVADAVREADEAFTMTLDEVTGGVLGTAVAVGAIQNDDAEPPLGTGPGGALPGTPGGGPAVPTGPIDGSQPVVRLANLAYRRSGARVRVKVTCPASETRCAGTVTVFNIVQSRSKIRALRRETRMARGTFTLTGGASVTLTMKTTAAGRKLLRSVKSLKVRAFGVARDPAGNTGIATKSGTFRR